MKNDMKKTILIVEDNASILEMIQLFLEEEGYSVLTSSEGLGVMDIVKKKNPDLILLDIWIPGLDGIEVAKNLKKNIETKDIPIVMVSAHPSAGKMAAQAGANELLPKPFNLVDLLSVIEKFIKA